MQEITYTPSQKHMIFSAKGLIDQALKTKDFLEVRIIGSAGTGKTTVMKAVLENILPHRKRVTITAPTHKALSVIKDKVPYGYSEKVYFKTLASFLCMASMMDMETEETKFTFTPKTESAFDYCDILVVDEASMIPKVQYKKLHELAKLYSKIMIFVGDSKQLPPVGEKISVATEPLYDSNSTTYRLTEIVRQGAGNPIIELSNNIPEVAKFQNNITEDRLGYFYTRDRDAVIQNLAKGHGSEMIKYLGWKNNVVDEMNAAVREYVYGPNPDRFYEGETIIINGNGANVKNNQEVEIERIDKEKQTFSVMTKKHYEEILDDKIKKMKLEKNTDGLHFNNNGDLVFSAEYYSLNKDLVYILEEHLEKQFRQAVKLLKTLYKARKIVWGQVCAFEERFVRFKYGYALTIHKSQGSTYRTVIVDLKDVSHNKPEYDRMIYTAITRASDRVIFYYKHSKTKEENE